MNRKTSIAIQRLSLLLRTVWHLRFTQMYYQILYRLSPARVPALKATPPRRVLQSKPLYLNAANGLVAADWEFRFLNHAHRFEAGHIEWQCPQLTKLWRYNLHYFDYLLAADVSSEQKAKLIDHWIAHNPCGAPDAWEPYTVSLRITNWVKYFQGLQDDEISPAWLASLALQAAWLERRLEYHLLANHLFKNAVALVFVGTFFAGPEGERWLKTGWRLFRAEMREQFLVDGGHYERSPMYHAICLVDCLDVLNLLQTAGAAAVYAVDDSMRAQIKEGVGFLRDVTLPDGGLALFNDAAHGIAPPAAEILEYAARLLGGDSRELVAGLRLIDRPHTGIFGAQLGQDKILIDAGPVGPDYQPGHAHCDTLSYELALNGARFIVDTGTYDYEANARRFACRSTRGHNTVMIDGAEQSEIWGVFRVARRAKPLAVAIRKAHEGFEFEGTHDGYLRLRGQPLPLRRLCFDGQSCYEIEDTILGRGVHRAESFIHLHPDYRVVTEGAYASVLGANDGLVATIEFTGKPEVVLRESEYHPEFGKSLTNSVICLRVSGRLPLVFGYRIRKV